MGLSSSGYDIVTGCSELGNESSSSITGREFADQISDYFLPKKGCAPQNQLLSQLMGTVSVNTKLDNLVIYILFLYVMSYRQAVRVGFIYC
jgi:hypothetical protein